MLFWIAVGIVIGFIFKPQLEELFVKVVKKIKDHRERNDY